LRSFDPTLAAPIFAIIAFVLAAFAGLLAVQLRLGGALSRGRPWVLAFASLVAFTLLVIVPDIRVMGLLGYLPRILLTSPFDAEFRDAVAIAVSPQVIHHVVSIVWGSLWALTALSVARATSSREGQARSRAWARSARGKRWAKGAVIVAVVVPLLYAIQRLAWAVGIPLGIDPVELANTWYVNSAAAWLALSATGGAVLTLGLVQRWGEVFPRWIPVLRGRRVPVMLAVIPALMIAAVIMSASIGTMMISVESAFGVEYGWMMVAPMLAWPLWSVALAFAAVAYYLRRSTPGRAS
jgi:hypothetical protein